MLSHTNNNTQANLDHIYMGILSLMLFDVEAKIQFNEQAHAAREQYINSPPTLVTQLTYLAKRLNSLNLLLYSVNSLLNLHNNIRVRHQYHHIVADINLHYVALNRAREKIQKNVYQLIQTQTTVTSSQLLIQMDFYFFQDYEFLNHTRKFFFDINKVYRKFLQRSQDPTQAFTAQKLTNMLGIMPRLRSYVQDIINKFAWLNILNFNRGSILKRNQEIYTLICNLQIYRSNHIKDFAAARNTFNQRRTYWQHLNFLTLPYVLASERYINKSEEQLANVNKEYILHLKLACELSLINHDQYYQKIFTQDVKQILAAESGWLSCLIFRAARVNHSTMFTYLLQLDRLLPFDASLPEAPQRITIAANDVTPSYELFTLVATENQQPLDEKLESAKDLLTIARLNKNAQAETAILKNINQQRSADGLRANSIFDQMRSMNSPTNSTVDEKHAQEDQINSQPPSPRRSPTP